MLLTVLTLNTEGTYPQGTIYAVVYPSALGTGITDQQVIDGNGPNGLPATWAGNAPSSTISGDYEWPSEATDLASSEFYRLAMVWVSGANRSNVSVSPEVMTTSDGIPVLSQTEVFDILSSSVRVRVTLTF